MATDIHGNDLPKDLAEIIAKAGQHNPKAKAIIVDEPVLMELLVMYIVRRDHLVHDAGTKVGKEIVKGNLEPEEEQ